MAQERTEAVVLKGVDFSETSRIVTFLSPDRGRVTCMAKGVRRPKSQLAGLLDTFNRLEIVYYWKDSRSVQQLGDAALLDGFQTIKHDLDKATYAAFPLELAGIVAHENEPSRHLYATLLHGMEGLTKWPGHVPSHGCWQVLQLLAAAGYEPSTTHCSHCGGELFGAVGFSFEGGAVCGSCPSDRKMSDDEFNSLRAMVGDTRLCPDTAVSPRLFDWICRYASRQVESNFRSIRVIEQMYGGV